MIFIVITKLGEESMCVLLWKDSKIFRLFWTSLKRSLQAP